MGRRSLGGGIVTLGQRWLFCAEACLTGRALKDGVLGFAKGLAPALIVFMLSDHESRQFLSLAFSRSLSSHRPIGQLLHGITSAFIMLCKVR